MLGLLWLSLRTYISISIRTHIDHVVSIIMLFSISQCLVQYDPFETYQNDILVTYIDIIGICIIIVFSVEIHMALWQTLHKIVSMHYIAIFWMSCFTFKICVSLMTFGLHIREWTTALSWYSLSSFVFSSSVCSNWCLLFILHTVIRHIYC